MQTSSQAGRRLAVSVLPMVVFGAAAVPALLASTNIPTNQAPRAWASLMGALMVLLPSATLWPLTVPQPRRGWLARGVLGGAIMVPHAMLVAFCMVPFWGAKSTDAYIMLGFFVPAAAVALAATAQALNAAATVAARPGTEVARSLARRVWTRVILLVGLTMLVGLVFRIDFYRRTLAWGLTGLMTFQFLVLGAMAMVVRDAWALQVIRHPWRHAVRKSTASDSVQLTEFDFGVGEQTVASSGIEPGAELILRGDRRAAVSLVGRGLVWSVAALLVAVLAVGLVLALPDHGHYT